MDAIVPLREDHRTRGVEMTPATGRPSVRRKAHRIGWVLAAAVSVGSVGGCGGPSGREDAAVSTARAFETALGAARFEQACALLAPETRKAVAEASPCGPALAGKRLPATAGAAVTQTFGRQAMVRLTGDTLFLSQFDAGWKVVAAGCTPRAEQPYDCLVKGA